MIFFLCSLTEMTIKTGCNCLIIYDLGCTDRLNTPTPHTQSLLFCFLPLFSDEEVRSWLVSQLRLLCGWRPPPEEEETKQLQQKVLSSRRRSYVCSCHSFIERNCSALNAASGFRDSVISFSLETSSLGNTPVDSLFIMLI